MDAPMIHPSPVLLPHLFAPLAFLLHDSGGSQGYLHTQILFPFLCHHCRTQKTGRLRWSKRCHCCCKKMFQSWSHLGHWCSQHALHHCFIQASLSWINTLVWKVDTSPPKDEQREVSNNGFFRVGRSDAQHKRKIHPKGYKNNLRILGCLSRSRELK